MGEPTTTHIHDLFKCTCSAGSAAFTAVQGNMHTDKGWAEALGVPTKLEFKLQAALEQGLTSANFFALQSKNYFLRMMMKEILENC